MRNRPSILLFILISFSLNAQEWTLKLSSNVELRTWKLTTWADKQEKGLVASIKLFKGSTVVNQMSSDANGDFTILVPAKGEFVLEVSYPGCNTKKFFITTMGVPDEVAKDNFDPTFSIGGFVMAKPFPGIDYSGLKQTLVKVEYKSKGRKFDNDDDMTNAGINIVSKITNAENILIEKFCSTNKAGDAALAIPDCPLAKKLYNQAIALIPGEEYPVIQLAKVGDCLKEMEAAAKKAEEKAAQDKIAAEKAAVEKAEADKIAKEKAAVDKLAAEKASAEKAEADKLAKEKAAADKAEEAKLAEEKKLVDKTAKEKANAEKAESDKLNKEKLANEKLASEKVAQEKLVADKSAKEKALSGKAASDKEKREKLIEQRAEKAKAEEGKVLLAKEQKGVDPSVLEAEAKRKSKAKTEKEKAAKQKEGMDRSRAEDLAAEKADYEKKEAKRKKREGDEYEKQKFAYETKHKDGTGEMDKGNSAYKIPQVIGANVYKSTILKADDFFKTKRYKEAKLKYEEALKQKANDNYAVSKIAQIEKILNSK